MTAKLFTPVGLGVVHPGVIDPGVMALAGF
jgi:hypothetical protein